MKNSGARALCLYLIGVQMQSFQVGGQRTGSAGRKTHLCWICKGQREVEAERGRPRFHYIHSVGAHASGDTASHLVVEIILREGEIQRRKTGPLEKGEGKMTMEFPLAERLYALSKSTCSMSNKAMWTIRTQGRPHG